MSISPIRAYYVDAAVAKMPTAVLYDLGHDLPVACALVFVPVSQGENYQCPECNSSLRACEAVVLMGNDDKIGFHLNCLVASDHQGIVPVMYLDLVSA